LYLPAYTSFISGIISALLKPSYIGWYNFVENGVARGIGLKGIGVKASRAVKYPDNK